MTKNAKIILNRVQKGKKLSQEEEKILLNELNNGPFTLHYASSYRQERWIEFEKALEDYCDDFGGLFSTNQAYLILYIRDKIKGPWSKVENFLNDEMQKKYREILIENNFEEYTI